MSIYNTTFPYKKLESREVLRIFFYCMLHGIKNGLYYFSEAHTIFNRQFYKFRGKNEQEDFSLFFRHDKNDSLVIYNYVRGHPDEEQLVDKDVRNSTWEKYEITTSKKFLEATDCLKFKLIDYANEKYYREFPMVNVSRWYSYFKTKEVIL